MKIIRFELYRAFHGKTFLIAILIGVMICVLDIITFCAQFGVGTEKFLVQSWIGTDYQFAYNEMFYVMLPVIACLPYGGSYYTDMKTGYDKNICIKTSRREYILAKCLAVFLSALTSVAIPLSFNLFIGAGLFPDYVPERLEFMSIGLLDRHLFTSIYSSYPAIYCMVFILIDGLFAGVIALTSLSLSKIVRSHFMAVVTPMIIVVISTMVFGGDDKGNWGLLEMLNPRQYVTTLWYQMVIVYLVILFVNLTVIWGISRKRDII